MRPEIHDFWITENSSPTERLDAMIALREYIEGLPKTAQTFKVTNIDGFHRSKFTEEMLVVTGSWRMPDVFAASDQSAEQWINPAYKDRHLFPASWARCSCGAILSRGYLDGGNKFQNEHDHGEDCSVPDRLRARAEMLERRQEVLVRGLRLGRSGRQLAPQIGIRAKGLGEIAKTLDVNIREEKTEFRKLAGRTYAEFQMQGIPAEKIARAYGCHPDSLARRAKEYTDYEYDHQAQEWVPPYEEDSGAKPPDWLLKARKNRGEADD